MKNAYQIRQEIEKQYKILAKAEKNQQRTGKYQIEWGVASAKITALEWVLEEGRV